METAIQAAQLSSDPSVQNGAVIYVAGKLVGIGYNGPTYGIDRSREDIWVRPQKYMWIEHAERCAIYEAARNGESLWGGIMFSPWAACADCARAIASVGIAELVRFPMGPTEGWDESVRIGDEVLKSAGVLITEVPMDSFDIPEGLRLGQFRS